MKKTKTLSALLAIALLVALSGCSGAPSPRPVFQSPLATASAASPLATPPPAPASPVSASEPGKVTPAACVPLAELEANVGRTVCVAAKVLATENKDNDFIMWLDQNPPHTYFVSRNTLYLGVEGTCLRATGVVQKDQQGHLYIREDVPGQLERCQP